MDIHEIAAMERVPHQEHVNIARMDFMPMVAIVQFVQRLTTATIDDVLDTMTTTVYTVKDLSSRRNIGKHTLYRLITENVIRLVHGGLTVLDAILGHVMDNWHQNANVQEAFSEVSVMKSQSM